MRYFIKLAYNGTAYHGWQIQPNAASVQQTLEKALTALLRTPISIMAAGRTDSGVHARLMYAHFDYDQNIDNQVLIHKINSFLPPDIVVFDFLEVSIDAHARFDAKKRTYEYHIHTFKNAFTHDTSWYVCQPLDVDLMNQGAELLTKFTDFQCFSKVNTDVANFHCTIFEAYWEIDNNKIIFTISANRFLRNMVRAIVGTLINLGMQKISIHDLIQIIESKNRSKAGFSVPAHGLYLTDIEYDYLQNIKNEQF